MLYSLRHIAPHRKFAHELHLDIFEHIIPPSLIADVLSETHSWEEREKTLNMPMVMAIIIAMGLLASCSIPHVLHKLANSAMAPIWPRCIPRMTAANSKVAPSWCASSNTPWTIPADPAMARCIGW